MLNSELKFYLKTFIGKPTVDYKLSNENNEKLVAYLNENCDEGSLNDIKKQLKIKQAFKEHFESVGYILFKISNNKIFLKVFPYKIEPKDSVNLPFILEILRKNKNLIEYEYNGNKNQISIPAELKEKIYEFINSIENEEVNKKELVRYAVNEFFELLNHDIVIIRDEHIFVKILDDKYKRKIGENEKGTIAGRYNGINEEYLKSLYDDFFAKEENKSFFYYTAKLFVQEHLLDKKIDNSTYEKKVFSLIQSIIVDQMNNAYNYDEDFCTGFSGYIFRIHFEEVFGHIANFILIEIAASNEYIIEFLRYYSLSIVVKDGKKYKVPELETEGGLRWNVISMMSIVKIYVKSKTAIDALKKEIDELEKNMRELSIEEHSPIEYQNLLNKEKDKITQRLFLNEERMEKFVDALKSIKSEGRKSIIRVEMAKIQEKMKVDQEEKAAITLKAVQKNIIINYNMLNKKYEIATRQLRREEKLLSQNKASYFTIKQVLVKALMSKTLLIA